jgi:hypothetical protein
MGKDIIWNAGGGSQNAEVKPVSTGLDIHIVAAETTNQKANILATRLASMKSPNLAGRERAPAATTTRHTTAVTLKTC